MRIIFCLLLALLSTRLLNSQDCKTLDKTVFFKSISFGKPIPEDLLSCAMVPRNGMFRAQYDSLTRQCQKKYADLFKFLDLQYSFVQIGTNQQHRISLVSLYSFFEEKRENRKEPPSNFINTYRKLTALYGSPTREERPNTNDSLFAEDLGIPLLAAWECDNIFLTLRVRYGARLKDLNVIEVQIMNRNFDIPEPVMLQ
jgi:hypothetical protein